MPFTLSTLRTELREHLGIDSTDLSDDDANLLINRSWWEIIDKFPFREKEQSTTFNTVDGTRSYALATIVSPLVYEALRSISVEDPDTKKHTKLEPISEFDYESLYIDSTDEEGKPERYLRENANLILYPTPDQVYEVTVRYNNILSDLSNTIAIPQSWHEIILFGAIWRGHARFRDYNASELVKRTQTSLISTSVPTEAKEQKDTRLAGLQVLGRDY